MSRFTVLGAQGLIGSRLAASLARDGHEVLTPARDDSLGDELLGHVVYAIGVTWDFRARAFDTMAAHVCRLNEVLRDYRFDSLLYLSSTRVYQGHAGDVDENSELIVHPQRSGDLYNISKLAGESLCLACGRRTRIARISNVYAPGDPSQNFLPSVIRSAVAGGAIAFDTAATSCRDYVHLDDVVALLPRIAAAGRERIYNVSSGASVSHGQLAERLAHIVPCRVNYAAAAPESKAPRISNARVRAEFGFNPRAVLDDLPELVNAERARREPSPCS